MSIIPESAQVYVKVICALLSAALEVMPLTMQVPLIPEWLGWDRKVNNMDTNGTLELHGYDRDLFANASDRDHDQEQIKIINSTSSSSLSSKYDVLVGVIFPSSICVAMVLGPIISRLSNYINSGLIVLLGMLFSPVVTLPMAYGYGMLALFGTRALGGAYASLTEVAYLRLIADVLRDNEAQYTRFLGLYAFMYDLDLFGPLLSGTLYSYVNQKTPFLLLMTLSLIVACIYYVFGLCCKISFRVKQEDDTSHSLHVNIYDSYVTYLKDKHMMIAALTVVIAGIPKSMLGPILSVWMMDTYNANESQVGLVHIPGLLGMVILTLIADYTVCRWQHHRWTLTIVAYILDGISLLAFSFCPNMIILMVVFGVQMSTSVVIRYLTFPLLTLIAESKYNITNSSSVTGFCYVVGLLSYIIGPLMSMLYPFVQIYIITIIGLFHVSVTPFLICLRNINLIHSSI